MAVFARNVNFALTVAPEKKEQFRKDMTNTQSLAKLMARAEKNIPNFKTRTIKR